MPSKASSISLTRTSTGHTSSTDGIPYPPRQSERIADAREKRAKQSAKYRWLIFGFRLIIMAALVSMLVDMLAVSMMSIEPITAAQAGTPTHPAMAGLFTDIQQLGLTIHRFAQVTYIGLGVFTAAIGIATIGKRLVFAFA